MRYVPPEAGAELAIDASKILHCGHIFKRQAFQKTLKEFARPSSIF